MSSERFRRDLRAEAQQWQRDGLIQPEQWQQLVDRYQLDQLEDAAQGKFVGLLISLGCLLIGLGIITFIAANWQEMGRWLKVGLLLTLFLGVNIGGFWLWQQGQGRTNPALGQGLLLIGNLSLGAMIGLFAQIFHISGPAHGLFFWWGWGVLAMAYGLRLRNLGILAIAAIGYGYWSGQWQVRQQLWQIGTIPNDLVSIAIHHMPVIAALLFIPLAYCCRSRLVFGLATIATGTAIVSACVPQSYQVRYPGVAEAAAFFLTPALLYSFDDRIWQGILRLRQPLANFQPIAKRLGVASFGIALYWFSLITQNNGGIYVPVKQVESSFAAWTGLPSIIALLVVLVVQWVYLLRSSRRRSLNHLVVTVMLAVAAIAVSFTADDWTTPWVGFVANGLTGLLGIGVIRESLEEGDRTSFWYGMALLTLLILTKVFTLNTELLFKALMLVACGFAIIFAGIWFEKYTRSMQRGLSNG
jgi:uncharacterized membrane protein